MLDSILNNLNRFFISMVIVGATLGGFLGHLVPDPVLIYFLPPWETTTLDDAGQTFVEITAVQIDDSETQGRYYTIYLKSEDGDYFSYSQNTLKPTTHTKAEIESARNLKQPCDDFKFYPPAFFFRDIKDSTGFEFDGALDGTSECYILFANNDIQYLTRYIDIGHIIFVPSIPILVGLIVGGLIAGFLAHKISRRRLKNSAV